jgi:CDP-paratose 2-epimerase
MPKKILITGGAGFIGSNAVVYFNKLGYEVHVLDNLSRTLKNISYINDNTKNVVFHIKDIRDADSVNKIIKENKYDFIIHLAAQVAVTTSVENPREDFNINALGTFNLLEAIRLYSKDTFFINVSTNKVYGSLEDVELIESEYRYDFKHNTSGINEKHPLDYHSPYGCSKGIADQYTIDYGRVYDIPVATLRQSCIYGERQFGIEDQGWLAWFLIAKQLNKKISIYGNGKQVRDILYIKDLIELYHAIMLNDKSNGNMYNVGGGASNSISLLEFLKLINVNEFTFSSERAGDQKIFISDNSKLLNDLNWKPNTDKYSGIEILATWIKNNYNLFS